MALRKTKTGNGQYRVTFELPAEIQADEVSLCGDFNGWSPDVHRLRRRKDGRFSTTVTLSSGRSYRFRYLIDDARWENDWQADSYVPNDFGGDDSVIELPAG